MTRSRRGGATAVTLLAALAACSPLPLPREGPYHRADADISVTRLGHASVIVELAGQRVVIDPWFYSGVIFRQTEPLALRPHALPSADAVLVTHGHADHCDRRALELLADRVPTLIVPPALAADLRDLGFAALTPLDWWEETRLGSITVTAVPSRHTAPENGYVLTAAGGRVYAAGDTRAFPGLADIAAAFPAIDVALLPIGGQRLLGVRREMGPEQAATAAAQLQAERVIPIGYGLTGGQPVYWYATRPIERFRAAARAAGLAPEQVVVLAPGESWHHYR